MDSRTKDEEFVSTIKEMFSEKILFNKVLGLKVESISYEHVRVSFQMRDDTNGKSCMEGLFHLSLILQAACPRSWAFNKECRVRL